MFVKELKQEAAARLKVVAAAASVQSAALALSDHGIGLLVVCSEGRAIGVVSKSDLIRHIAAGGRADTLVAPVMSAPIVACTPEDELYWTWETMSVRGLQNMPVVGSGGEPLGVLDIRDALGALLDEERYQERLLANYISGVGYR